MIGGTTSGKQLSTYDSVTNKWSGKSIMNTGREGAGSVVVNQKIYTCLAQY